MIFCKFDGNWIAGAGKELWKYVLLCLKIEPVVLESKSEYKSYRQIETQTDG
jgi:hypothetical protein